MKILMLIIARFLTRFANRLGKMRGGYGYDVLVVGNYEHRPDYQQRLVDTLKREQISNRFLFDVEKSNYFLKMLAYMRCSYLIARSRNVLVFDYCFPLYCVDKLPGQKFYQLWHANGSFKSFGMPNFRERHGEELADRLYRLVPIHSTYDYIFVSNERCVPYYMEAFNDFQREKYIVANTMLLDQLIDDSRERPYRPTPGRVNVVLAPTYNYSGGVDLYQRFTEAIRAEAGQRGCQATVTTLLHPKLAPNFNKEEVLMQADILITDYSSVCFEVAAMGRKVAFLRGEETMKLFVEAAKKVYHDPQELAVDILEDRIIDNGLNDYLCFNGNRQLETTMQLIKQNRAGANQEGGVRGVAVEETQVR